MDQEERDIMTVVQLLIDTIPNSDLRLKNKFVKWSVNDLYSKHLRYKAPETDYSAEWKLLCHYLGTNFDKKPYAEKMKDILSNKKSRSKN